MNAALPSTAFHPPGASLRALLADLADDVDLIDAVDAPDRYLESWSGHRGARVAVIRPRTPEAVPEVLRRLSAAGQRVVVQGGLTGLVDSCLPAEGEVVLSLELLDRIESCDPLGCTMTVQAGVPLEAVHRAAEAQGLFFPVDLGSRGSCQIGGNIATNAGGNRVLQYGMMRSSVLGLEVALADGNVFSHMRGVLKDNTGYDLKQLFIGSEGTLGVVTRALLRLYPLPRSRHTAVIGVQSLAQVFDLLVACRRQFGPGLTSFEVMWRDYVEYVTVDLGIGRDPFNGACPQQVLIEVSGFDRRAERDEARMVESLEIIAQEIATDHVVVAQSLAEAAALWRVRESSGEVARAMGKFLSFDISIPAQSLQTTLAHIRAGVDAVDPTLRAVTYGHLGDGNLHLVIACADPVRGAAIEVLVYDEVTAVGGSISAEHGIGREKRERFEALTSAVEVDAMRRIKQVFDPQGLLNRGRIFDLQNEGASV